MPNCIKLEWAEPPKFRPCAIGEPADYRGLKINAIYDNGTRDTIEVARNMFNESALHATGTERKCMIIYAGQRMQALVPLFDAYLDHIEASAREPLVFHEGDELDRNRITVTAFYSNGTSRAITNYKVFPYTPFELGQTELSIRYGRSKAVLDLTVLPTNTDMPEQSASVHTDSEPQPQQSTPFDTQPHPQQSPPIPQVFTPPETKKVRGVSVSKVPSHQKYLLGDVRADLSGGRLDIIYDDGTAGQIDMMPDGEVFVESSKPGRGYVSFECFGKPVTFPIEVLEPQIIRLTVTQMPAKQLYIEGEELDLTGLVLEAVYNDASTRVIRGLQSNGFIVTRAHAEEGVTLSFDGAAFTIPVQVEKEKVAVTPIGLTVSKPPAKTEYVERDRNGIDMTGAELMLQMSDGRRELLPVTVDMLKHADISKPGQTTVAVEYFGFEVSFSINVLPRKLTSLEIKSAPKRTTYVENERIDLLGVIINACYNNGEKEPVSDYEVSPETAVAGTHFIAFKYRNQEVRQPISVRDLSVVLLDWVQRPAKMLYYTHEKEFSCEGGILKARYNNGTEEKVVLTKEMVSGFCTNHAGVMPLKVSYKNSMTPLSVTVEERVLLGLRIAKQPRLEYAAGESFDMAGLVVEAMYTGGTAEEVAVNCLPYGPLQPGKQPVMLVYQEKAVMVTVDVSESPTSTSSAEEYAPFADEQPKEIPKQPPIMDSSVPAPAEQPVAALEPEPEPKPVDIQQAPVTSLASVTGGNSEILPETKLADKKTNPESETMAEGEKRAPAEPQKPKVIVPNFYPSTFCIRFQEESDEAFV